MVFNMVGGAPLNFTIVGGISQPSSASENTIWINTDTDISSWVASPVPPSTPSDGMLWLSTGMTGAISINAVKSNAVMLYPIVTKQYITDSWVAKTAMIYQNGWKDLSSDLLIYNDGTVHVPVTFVNATNKETYIQVNLSKNGNASVKTENQHDLSQYRTATVEYSNLSGGSTGTDCYIRLRITNANGDIIAQNSRNNTVSGSISLDISALTSMCYVEVYCNNTSGSAAGSARISKIALTV